MNEKAKCTLTDQELIGKAKEWIYSLAKSKGDVWVLSIPVNFNKDPDIIFMELCDRLAAKLIAPPSVEQKELWKEFLDEAAKRLYAINAEIISEDTAIFQLSEKYSITRKEEVPEAVEFKDWCEKNESALCFQEQRTLSTAELYAEFQLFKQRS